MFKFLDLPLRNIKDSEKLIKSEHLFFEAAESVFETGKMPLSNCPKSLRDISPSENLY